MRKNKINIMKERLVKINFKKFFLVQKYRQPNEKYTLMVRLNPKIDNPIRLRTLNTIYSHLFHLYYLPNSINLTTYFFWG